MSLRFLNAGGEEIGKVTIPTTAKTLEVFRDGRFGWKCHYGALFKLAIAPSTFAGESVATIVGLDKLTSLTSLNLSRDMHSLTSVDKWLPLATLTSLTEITLPSNAVSLSLRSESQGSGLAKALRKSQLDAAAKNVLITAAGAESSDVPTTSTTSSEECLVCFNKGRECAFVPCGHLACCTECAAQLERCVICNALIVERMRVFVP
jgi:hypothetical protein